MKTIRFCAVLSLACFVLFVACAGGGGNTTPTLTGGNGTSGKTARVTISITIPRKAAQTAVGHRAPQYVSVNTQSLSFLLNTVDGSTPSPTPTATVINVTSTTNGCTADSSNPGNYICTLSVLVPVGSDNATLAAYDAQNATGNVLSRVTPTFTVTAGVANAFSFTMGANPSTMTVTGPTASSFVSGSLGSGYTLIGSATQNFTLGLSDPSGATIVGPGNPTISVNSANAAFVASGVTSSGFSLNAAGYSTSSVQVTVNALPPASSGFSALSTSFNVSETPLVAIAFYQSGAGEVQLYTPGSGTALTLFNSTPIASGANDAYAVAFGSTGILAVGNAAGSGTQESASLYNSTSQASGAPAPQATTAAGAVPVGPGNVQSIGVYADGTVVTSNNSGIADQITLYASGHLSSGIPLTMPSPSAAGYGGKQAAFLPNGNAIVALISGTNAGAIAMVPAGATTCGSCSLVTAGVNEPEAVAVDPVSGHFFVSNYGGGGASSGTITEYSEAGTLQGTVASSLDKPFTLAVSPDGNYASYASGASDNSVNIVSRGSTWTTLCTTTLTGAMRGMAWLADDTLVASATGTVGRYNTSCAGTTIGIPGSRQGSVVAVSP